MLQIHCTICGSYRGESRFGREDRFTAFLSRTGTKGSAFRRSAKVVIEL
ncbi:hypothetical protein M123_2061 [Bacteroides fragilis str. 3976T8]|uniref:Uncharacterized protein n=1 Tax=Bacteroides fragilis str. 3976T8 TaxID=1339314 RepID=A0A016E888_BACFG|nr:hypothetical protein M123_2061 [Bacteroides fragilis str. 3976T8]